MEALRHGVLATGVEQSGIWEDEGALKRHGRGRLRALLVQSAKKDGPPDRLADFQNARLRPRVVTI